MVARKRELCRYCCYKHDCSSLANDFEYTCALNGYSNFKPIKTKGEYIICAAIHYKSDEKFEHQPKNILSGFVLAGWRHFNIMPIATRLGRRTIGPDHTQGFLTNKGEFVGRQMARVIAYNAKQIKTIRSRNHIKDLFSEDIY